MSAQRWNEYSAELDRIQKTLNDADIDARIVDINKYFTRTEEFNRRFKTMSYNGDLQSQDVLKFFKLNMSNKLREDDLARRDVLLRMVDDKIACALVYKSFIIGEHVIGFIFLLATHKQHRLKEFARHALGQYTLALMEVIKARQLKGGLILSKCVIDLVSFYKKCSFSPAEAPFSSWAERGTKMMCLELNTEEDDEEEKVPEKSAVKQKAVAVKQAVNKTQTLAKTTKKVKSAFEDSMSQLLLDSDDVGLAPANKEKPVQIDTSTIKVAAKTKKVAGPRGKSQLKTKATAVFDDEAIMDSDEESVKSQATRKSEKRLDKHCTTRNCDGKLISGPNWAKHVERKHSNGVVSYCVCKEAICDYCRQGPRPKPVPVRCYTCIVCEEERRYDRFPAKDRSVCVFCLDGKSCRGSVKALEKGSLKSALLDQLPQQTTLQQLNDSANDIDNDSIVASVGHSSSKRQKTVIHLTTVEPENIEFDIVKQLKVIESNGKSVYINALVVQDLCYRFNQDLILQFFTTGDHPNLLQCVFTVLTRLNSLSNAQFIGLLSAAFALGHKAWDNSKLALGQADNEKRNSVLHQLKWVIQKQYGERIANWCCIYWNYLNKDQFTILEALKQSPQAADDSILMISLCSEICEVYEYIKLISSFVRNAQPAFQLLHTNLKTNPKQIKTTFTTFIELTQVLQDTRNVTVIESIRDTLLQIPVAKWKEQIELARATSAVIDGDSIQKSLNEFISKYGKPDPKLAADLSLAGDVRFQFFTKVVLNPPNNKQFAAAQYCIGLLKTHHRQMWCVPSGQGKGRIEHTLAVFALLLGFSKVYIIYPSKQLCDRDADDFSTYLDFVEKDQIQYCIGIDGVVIGDNELAIFDEGDAIMHSDPDKFRDFISKCLCVCFTATPDDQDPRGVDIQVLKAMTFPTFYYVIDVLERIVKFDFDLELPAIPVTEKAAEVKKLSQTGPVVVHCASTLYDKLKKLDLELVEADENVNHQILRTLGLKVNDKFRVAVALTTASMRGLDYRSSVDGILISLVIAKSFVNKREAIQGYYRVGRFGDKCYRVAFKDVDLIDAKAELTYKLNAFKFLQALSRKTIQMKQFNATDLTGQNKKTPAATGKTTPTRQDKNLTTGQIKASYQGSMGRKRTNALVPQLLQEKQGFIEQTPQPSE